MRAIREILNEAWGLFRMAGVADDLAIIEHLGAMLVGDKKPSQSDLMPKEISLSDSSRHSIQLLIQEALQQVSAAEFFDKHILFRLSSMQPGGRYPTPRHLTKFMADLAELRPDLTIADFACGSGGLLLASGIGDLTPKVGCDISADWTRLAWINGALKNSGGLELRSGNAIRLALNGGFLAGRSFDRILMNPAFGEPMEPSVIEAYFGSNSIANRSEIALFRLAIDKLASLGRVVVLLPVGLLGGATASDRAARAAMTEKKNLRAVIALPKDSMQPYSPVQGHIVVVDNIEVNARSLVWFILAEDDGYPAGRTRDYSRPPTVSDLDLVSKLLTQHAPTEQSRTDALLSLTTIKIGDIGGLAFWTINPDSHISEIRFYPYISSDANQALLVTIANEVPSSYKYIHIDLVDGKQRIVDALESFEAKRRKEDGRSKQFQGAGRILHSNDFVPVKAALLTVDGRLLGLAMPQSEIHDDEQDLRPGTYLHATEKPVAQRSPGALLAEIRTSQKRIAQHLDNLFGKINFQSSLAGRFPSPIWTDEQALSLIESFSADQKVILQRVFMMCDEVEDENSRYRTPIPFNSNALRDGLSADVRLVEPTLHILCQLGIIIPVTIEQDSAPGERLYRITTERDRWNGERLLFEEASQ